MSRVKVMQNNEEVILYKTNLEEFAHDIFKTKVGIATLRKLGIAIGYENSFRSVYYLIEISPLMRTLLKTMPTSRRKQQDIA